MQKHDAELVSIVGRRLPSRSIATPFDIVNKSILSCLCTWRLPLLFWLWQRKKEIWREKHFITSKTTTKKNIVEIGNVQHPLLVPREQQGKVKRSSNYEKRRHTNKVVIVSGNLSRLFVVFAFVSQSSSANVHKLQERNWLLLLADPIVVYDHALKHGRFLWWITWS